MPPNLDQMTHAQLKAELTTQFASAWKDAFMLFAPGIPQEELRDLLKQLKVVSPVLRKVAINRWLVRWVEETVGLHQARLDSAPIDHGIPFSPDWPTDQADPGLVWVRDVVETASKLVHPATGAVIDTASGTAEGSGVLVGPKRFLTVGHVGNDPELKNGKCSAVFSRVVPNAKGWSIETKKVAITEWLGPPANFLATGPTVTLLGLAEDVATSFQITPVELAGTVGPGNCFCVHFPKQDAVPSFKVALNGVIKMLERSSPRPFVYKTLSWGPRKASGTAGFVVHGCNSQGASSGAPIFDVAGKLLAINNGLKTGGIQGTDDEYPHVAVDVTAIDPTWLKGP